MLIPLLRTFYEHAPVGFAFVDREFRYQMVNPYLERIHHRPAHETVGRTVAEAIPKLWPRVESLYRRALAGEVIINHDITGIATEHGDASRHWLVSYYPVRDASGAISGVGIIVNDVSARKSVERALAARTDLYAMLARAQQAVSRSRSVTELYDRLCASAVETGHFRCAWIGVPRDGVLRRVAAAGEDGGYLDDLVIALDPDDPRSQGPSGRAARLGEPIVVNDFASSPLTAPWHERARRAGFASSTALPLLEGGKVAAVLTLYAAEPDFFTADRLETLNEITPAVSFALDAFVRDRERRRSEADLRLLDRAVQAVSQGIVIVDARAADLPIIYVSASFERLTGYTADEVRGRNCRFLQAPGADPAELDRLRAAIREGRACTVELLNQRKDGSLFWNELTISPVRDASGGVTQFVGVQADVSARRQLEEQFRQSQKMEAIGQLAGGIAHDFNNLLLVINGYAERAASTLPPDSPLRPMLAEVERAGQRAASLTHQLLAFSRREVVQPRVVTLNAAVADAEKMVRRLVGEDVETTLQFDAATGAVYIDPGQLTQVLVNLAVNARDAMPRGGRLTLATTREAADQPRTMAGGVLPAGVYARLSVTDTGSGMTDDVRQRIFEPFFTTKPVGKGTGLGLATVHGIVAAARGGIDLTTTPGAGTTFTVWLPQVDAAASAAPADPAGEEALPAGTETILVVEDEGSVRGLMTHLLRLCGYHVLEVADGIEALALCEQHAGTIDLVVSDVVMPRLGGREQAERITARRPACRLLFVSGYTADAVVRHGVEVASYAFLQKPFTTTAFARKVRDVLDAPR